MSLFAFIKRARASTKSILGDEYVDEVVDHPKPPQPPKDVTSYNDSRLKRGLIFADHALLSKTRKVSPITSHCLTLYKSAVKALLEEEYTDEEEKQILLATVLAYERQIYTTDFLRRVRSKIRRLHLSRM